MANGHDAPALDLVAALYPLMDRLRFHPELTDESPASTALVHVRSVGDVTDQLRRVRPPDQVTTMNEALIVWRPLYDRLVALWRETVEDDWPCARWPADWTDRRSRWLEDYETAAATHTRCRDHRGPRSNFAILRSALEACAHDSSASTGRDVGRIRMVLNRSVACWGEPGSERLRELTGAAGRLGGAPTGCTSPPPS